MFNVSLQQVSSMMQPSHNYPFAFLRFAPFVNRQMVCGMVEDIIERYLVKAPVVVCYRSAAGSGCSMVLFGTDDRRAEFSEKCYIVGASCLCMNFFTTITSINRSMRRNDLKDFLSCTFTEPETSICGTSTRKSKRTRKCF